MKRPVDGEPVRIADYFKGGLKTHMVGVLGGMIWCGRIVQHDRFGQGRGGDLLRPGTGCYTRIGTLGNY